jgi:hypothetical protein
MSRDIGHSDQCMLAAWSSARGLEYVCSDTNEDLSLISVLFVTARILKHKVEGQSQCSHIRHMQHMLFKPFKGRKQLLSLGASRNYQIILSMPPPVCSLSSYISLWSSLCLSIVQLEFSSS